MRKARKTIRALLRALFCDERALLKSAVKWADYATLEAEGETRE
jgi:hypothetical protein